MATRSLASMAMAQRHPSSTWPTTFVAGTRTSVKNTSLKPEPPVIWRSGRTSTPGAEKSMMNMVMPRCFGLSGFGAGDDRAEVGVLRARSSRPSAR